jgi:hypothetical protein
MKHKILGLLVGGLALAATASPAPAAKVSVEIEGQAKVLAPTTVQTATSVNKDGTNTCDGDTAIGALDAATTGNWSGAYSYNNYSVETLLGESHAFGSGGYWTFYVNGSFQNDGACAIHVHDGDQVLFYAGDDPFVAGQGGYDEPVILNAPAKVTVGVPFTVTVKDAVTTFDANYAGTTHFQPASGATVTAGAATATTGPDGAATLTVADRGPLALVATQGNRAPARTAACATDGADGYCGTTKPDGTTVPGGALPATTTAATTAGDAAGVSTPCATNGHDGRCGTPDRFAAYGFVSSVATGTRYATGKGPRELKGHTDADPSGIAAVRLRLTRNDHGTCAGYDGRREAFRAIRCGATHGSWFSVGDQSPWTYLLPSRLPRGRYVLDTLVVDKAGNKDDQLARGRNRVVFTVA